MKTMGKTRNPLLLVIAMICCISCSASGLLAVLPSAPASLRWLTTTATESRRTPPTGDDTPRVTRCVMTTGGAGAPQSIDTPGGGGGGRPDFAQEVRRLFNMSCGSEGWFLEKHPKLAPVSTPTSGVFLAVNRDSREKIRIATFGSWMPIIADIPMIDRVEISRIHDGDWVTVHDGQVTVALSLDGEVPRT